MPLEFFRRFVTTFKTLYISVYGEHLPKTDTWYQSLVSNLRPVYTGDFCRSKSMQLNAIFVAPKLQPAAISFRFYCNLLV